MRFFRTKRDIGLDQAIHELRADQPDAKTLSASAGRVWERLLAAQGEQAESTAFQVIRGCADMRALLPAFYKQELPAARALLVEDHLRECASCRSYVHGRGFEGEAAAKWQMDAAPRGFQWSFARLAFVGAAAALIAVAGLGVNWYWGELPGYRAQIASIDGQASAVSATGIRLLRPGDEIGSREFIRTSGGSHATVRLFDGSEVEMNQRAQFAVSANRRNTTIHLDQGNIIVHAAKRHTGHLYVSAPDCNVAVTGTVFSVNSGTKGSRVTVIEGEVHVKHAGQESILHSGDQVATTQAVGRVPVREEIGWSKDLDQELALLAEFHNLSKKFEQIPTPAPRYESKILPLLPQDTVLYIGIPNLGDALQQANEIFQQQLAQSPVLQQWWNQGGHSNQHPTPEELIAEIRTLSQYLGDEVVITMSGSMSHNDASPLLLAEVRQTGLEDFLKNHLAEKLSNEQGNLDMHVVTPQTLSSLADGTHGMIMLVRPNMLVAGGDAASVRRMNAQLDAGTNVFSGTDFGQRILNVYSQGAETLVAVDFGEMLETTQHENSKAFQSSGFGNVKYLIATRGDSPNRGDNRLTLEFNGQRQGMASWLAAPAPMGSLDYVSANAGAAFSVVGKQPALMVDDAFNMMGASDANFSKDLAETNAKLGFDIRDDLASALGGELTIALDGPVLPTPSWKMIVEVNNVGAVQLAIQKLVEDINQEELKANKPGVTLDQEQRGGRTFYSIRAQGPGLVTEYDYTFADGYMLVAPSRALLLNALQTHANGTSLALSSSFRSILPSDNQANFSAMFYQNLSPALKPLASELTSRQFAILQQLAADSKPSVVCAYGENDRIEVATNGKLLDLNPGIMTVLRVLGQTEHGTSGNAHP
ncbi:MAG TPA: FecR domain-containing protein [Candidatus Methylomirabilis sp.]|nr:FecR domain-containing protein [Candidatus Methylomirabilis sp.]